MSHSTAKIHYSGLVAAEPAQVAYYAGVACRPDGEYGRRFVATSDPRRVTCLACRRAMGPVAQPFPIRIETARHAMTIDERADRSGITIRCSCGDAGLSVGYFRSTVVAAQEYALAVSSLHRSTGSSLLDLANGDA